MLVKKKSNTSTILKIIALVGACVLVFVFRTYFTNWYLNIYQKIFRKDEAVELRLDGIEELSNLRLQNKVLQDEVQKTREEFSVGLIDEVKSPVFMLLGDSKVYGNFYVSLPKNKTPYKGMNIFSTGNIVVGTVEEILQNSLKISRLGQDKTFIAESQTSEESLELKSLGSGLYVGNVAGGSKIVVGDSIVLKGYPKAIIGSVVEVAKGDSSLSSVFIRTPYNINNKEIFYVIQ